MPATTIRRELGAFLRAARAQLTPADLGLSVHGSRRVRGLRREEVAAVSGIGLSWYTWLEQGRVATSRQVLDALASTLRLGEQQHRHVLVLGGFQPEPQESTDSARLSALLAEWARSPALLLDHRFDVHAVNEVHHVVWQLIPEVREGTNLLLAMATEPDWRDVLVDERDTLYELFLRFRAQADLHPTDPRCHEVLRTLRNSRPDLAHYWECRDVRDSGTWPVVVTDGSGGRPRFDFTLLRTDGASGSLLVQVPGNDETREWVRGRISPGEVQNVRRRL
ncbi:Helix-turn-helix domain-containing protein [Actinopolyspora lacussalsi subsp. righensis]|uniref:Helix-turn-helix domain-containing protein n=1 Tax=Actinopolyspora righensis TaxID=995060 RepID=A0A1I6Y862_9ACTN|nr:helix-turn-helix transcriptional regulator [Actinopolyspora righensis]SFT46567.1 Helix-turn-helix domain-containing protein [Actinopolyspora righensis]